MCVCVCLILLARANSPLSSLRVLRDARLGKKHGMDVGKDASRRDRDTSKKLVELLVVLDREGDVPGNDAALLVVARGIARELEDLCAEILQDGGEVHSGADADALGVAALLEVAAHAGDGELETGLGGGADGLAGSASSLSLSALAGSSSSFSWGGRRGRREEMEERGERRGGGEEGVSRRFGGCVCV